MGEQEFAVRPAGRFVVLEGIDGSGTSTQAAVLVDRIRAHHQQVFVTCEPTDSEVGTIIRRMLSGDRPAHPDTLAHLFAADRHDHLYRPEEGILARLTRGEVVVCDRYSPSSLVYQGEAGNEKLVDRLNRSFPHPDLTVFVQVPVQIAVERLAKRKKRDLYEVESFQRLVASRYERVLADYSSRGAAVAIVDGTGTVEEVARRIWSAVENSSILGV